MSTPSRRTFSLALVVAFALIAIVAGFSLRAPIERALVLRDVATSSGLRVDARGVESASRGGYALDDVVASTTDGSANLRAGRAFVRRDGNDVAIELDRPIVTIDADRFLVGLANARDALSRANRGAGATTVAIRGGSLSVERRRDGAATLAFASDGTLRVARGRTAFDGTLVVRDGARAYPLVARATTDGSQGWSADAIPLSPFARALPAGRGLDVRAGVLSAFSARERGGVWEADAHLAGASFALGGRTFDGIHGALAFRGDGIGSRGIVGSLGGTPFSAAGEVHGLDRTFAWLAHGSRDLRALGAIATTLGGEPSLRWSRVEATAPGVTFGQYGIATAHGPLAITLLDVDPAEPTLRFDTAIAEDRVISGGERTSALGVRTNAIGGVNGDYFDIGRTYQPQGMLVSGGRLVRGPTDRAALVIDRDRHVTFDEFKLRGEVRTARGTMPITEFNDWPPGDVAVITPAFGKTLPAAPGRTFVALAPAGADPTRYRVEDVETLDEPRPVRFGLAIGPLVRVPAPKRGEIVRLRYALDPSVPNAIAGIGGGPILLRDGAWYEDPHAPAPDERNYRWPVIALAKRDDGSLMFVAVDGRHPERSIGATRPEFAAILRRLGARDAMALDSGGSVTLVARAPGDAKTTVRNVPSDNSAERWISDGLFLYSSAPVPTLVPAGVASTPVPEARPTP